MRNQISLLMSLLPLIVLNRPEPASRTKSRSAHSHSQSVDAIEPCDAPPEGDRRVWRLKKAEIEGLVGDSTQDTERLLQAMTMLIPSSWSLQGRPEHLATPDCNFTSGRISFTAKSADRFTGLRVIPTSATLWSDNRAMLQQIQLQNQRLAGLQDCRIAVPKAISQSLLDITAHLFAQFHAEGNPQPIPELIEQIRPALEQVNNQLAQLPTASQLRPPRLTAKAATVKVSAVKNGRPIEVRITALQTVRTEPLPTGGSLITNDMPLLAVTFAPPGHLDQVEGLLNAMLASVQLNPEWQAEVARANNKRMETVANANASFHETPADLAVRSYTRSVIETARNFAPCLGDQMIYRHPSTGEQMQLPGQYRFAWAGNSANPAEYVLTDSPSYNPNAHSGSGSWTKLNAQI